MKISEKDNVILNNIVRNTISHFETLLDKQGFKTKDIDLICGDIGENINIRSKEFVKNINEFALPSVTLLIAMKLFLYYGEIYDEMLEKVRKMRGITKQQLDEEIRIVNEKVISDK